VLERVQFDVVDIVNEESIEELGDEIVFGRIVVPFRARISR
jgi:hypothetical protein